MPSPSSLEKRGGRGKPPFSLPLVLLTSDDDEGDVFFQDCLSPTPIKPLPFFEGSGSKWRGLSKEEKGGGISSKKGEKQPIKDKEEELCEKTITHPRRRKDLTKDIFPAAATFVCFTLRARKWLSRLVYVLLFLGGSASALRLGISQNRGGGETKKPSSFPRRQRAGLPLLRKEAGRQAGNPISQSPFLPPPSDAASIHIQHSKAEAAPFPPTPSFHAKKNLHGAR